MRPPVLILHASGANRDAEAAAAVELAGGDPRIVHVNRLRSGEARIADHAALLLPGGFSYGDALGAGGRLGLELRTWFADELAAAVTAGRPLLGICNGFQALVKAGLLPGREPRRVTLTVNANGRFECRWVTLRVEPGARPGWLEGIKGTLIRCPVAHGEGRLAVSGDPGELDAAGLVAFRYLAAGASGPGAADDDPAGGDDPEAAAGGAYPANPNGSAADIAGLTDHSGTVVGLMPHPEDHVFDWQRPSGTPGGLGLALFEAFVGAAR